MFGLFQQKNPYEQAAGNLYQIIADQAREPAFYTEYSVPDTIDGRYDLLLLHIFMVLHRLIKEEGAAKDMAQALFDITFADMDQALRQVGIGDMGIPKHMRRMMKAFNGRMHAYETALKGGTLETALERNVYGGRNSQVKKLESHVLESIGYIEKQDLSLILRGEVLFLPTQEKVRSYG